MDAGAMCRCCLSTDTELKDITSSIEFNNSRDRIIVILREYLNIQANIGDEYPQSVCDVCINQLTNIYAFRLTVINSYKTFKCHSIKVEYAENKTQHNVKVEAEHYEEDLLESDRDSEKWDADVNDLSNDSCEDGKQAKKESEQSEEGSPSPAYFYCTCCSDKFPTARELYTHCCDSHPPLNKKGEICKYCNEFYPFPKTLKMHMKKHLFPFVCPFCCKGFEHLKSYQDHVRTCDVDDRKPQKKRASKKSKSSSVGKVRQCQYCGKSFTTDYFYEHLRIHREKKYICKLCGKGFAQPSSYKGHVRDAHSAVQQYKCLQCDKKFKSRNGRYTHVRLVHNKERTKICSTCGKGFFSKIGLERHLLTHSGVKPHSCRWCDKAYQTAWGLKVHLRSHNLQASM